MPLRHQVTKTFSDFPCAHRSWQHAGKCRFLHGYDRSFTITFEADALDPETGFVIDFSDLDDVRELLRQQFDHTVVVAHDDPSLPTFRKLHDAGVFDLRVMDHPGMEGATRWVMRFVGDLVRAKTSGRVAVTAVEARENEKNAARLFLS